MRAAAVSLRPAIAALVLLMTAVSLPAHEPSTSYLDVDFAEARYRAVWAIAVEDIAAAVAIDADGDRVVTGRELAEAAPRIAAHALATLQLSSPEGVCTSGRVTQTTEARGDGVFVALDFPIHCPDRGSPVLRYTLLSTIDPTHTVRVRWRSGGYEHTARVPTGGAGLLLARN